eukprot:XP_001709576.1 Hypothetical protein GL50803_22008 [Giardia lamblia ATCC 50803]
MKQGKRNSVHGPKALVLIQLVDVYAMQFSPTGLLILKAQSLSSYSQRLSMLWLGSKGILLSFRISCCEQFLWHGYLEAPSSDVE